MFFNDPKQLLKKLEIIIGEIIAGNTSIKMRNTGVALLDTLLRLPAINKSQYKKLQKNFSQYNLTNCIWNEKLYYQVI